MRTTSRTVRELGVIGIVLALVMGIIVAAVQAEGERTVRPDTNDGGAWLINGSAGAVGHVNRGSREITGAVSLADQGDRIDTEQSGSHVVVVNRSKQTLKLVDARTFQDIHTTNTPAELSVRLTGDTAVLWTQTPLRVWRQSIAELGELEALDTVDPLIGGDEFGRGQVAVSRSGHVIATTTDSTTGRTNLHRMSPSAGAPATIELATLGGEVIDVSAHGDDAVLLTMTGAVHVVPMDSEDAGTAFGFSNGLVLGQPTLAGEPVSAITSDGNVVLLDLQTSNPLPRVVASVTGTDPLPPIVHAGCVFVVMSSPAQFTRICNGVVNEEVRLTGVGNELRVRLINDWVWINDLDTGTMWVIDDDAPLDRIDDWGAALSDNADDADEDESDNQADGQIEQRENPDADDANVIRADEIDEDGMNERPVANDDEATTRADLPIVIDVVQNDIDPDGDVLLISELADIPTGTLVAPTATNQSIQFHPPAGATGTFRFVYTITDGRGGSDSATVTVEVVDPFTNVNQPPIAVTDAATARAGSSAALNVLDNDRDPDGDSIVLRTVDADSGTVKFDPSGQVTFIPDPGSAEGVETLRYTIADSFGATANGNIRVSIRLKAANNAPDARNDSAVIPVGTPLSMNVLFNDTDPDGNAISVGADPVRISPVDTDAELQLTADGQLFFTATTPGQYLYRYTITDAEKQDTALIRIVVTEVAENRPPIAVRDDVTVPRAGKSTVFVLANDYDPDGDVVAIDSWTPTEHLTVESFRGVGLVVEVGADAPEQLSFRYTITDGLNPPVTGTVVVAVSAGTGSNQPPIATADILEVRPGTTAVAPVVANDFDPEGAPLRIVNVSDTTEAELRISATQQEVLVSLPADATSGFTFAYDIVDEAGNLAGTTVDVRIVPEGQTNRPPIARADSTRTGEEQSVRIPVLNNDSDPDGDVIRLESIAAQPNAGTAAIIDGVVVYTPDAGFAGTDRFRYVVADPFDGRSVGEVLIGVIPAPIDNRPPAAADDLYRIIAGSDTLLLDVTANDYDPDGDDISVIRSSGGAISITDDGKGLLFEPPVGLERDSVEVTATYTIDDGRGGTSTARVTIEVIQTREPEAPIAVDDTVGPMRPGDVLEVDVTVNDIDPDGKREDLVVSFSDTALATGSTPGSLAVTAGETTSTHTYTITDPDGLESTGVITAIVFPNVAPEVAPLAVDTLYESPVAISLGTQATDIDDDDLFFVCCDAQRGGSTEISASAAGVLDLVFSPNPGFSGVAGFSYTVDDQNGHIVSGSVSITVAPKENGAPTATDATLDVEAGTSASISLAALTDDEDLVTGDTLTYSLDNVTLPDASLSGDTVTVRSAIDAGNTSGTISYTVTDSDGLTASGVVSVTVTESRIAPPIAVGDTATTLQTVPVDISVFDNDVDPIGNGLRLISVGSVQSVGTVDWNETTGIVTFSPAVDFFGTAQLTYTIEDARTLDSGRATSTIDIDVTGFPGQPATPQAVADDSTATVTWQQPETNGGAILNFQVQSDTGIDEIIPVTSGITYDLLTNGEPISFRIRAENIAGFGAWSAWSAPVTPDAQPGRPGAPTVEFRDQALFVTWSEPANRGTTITNYALEIGGGMSDTITLFNTTSYLWEGLTNSVGYQFKVTAINAAGPSDESAWSSSEHPLREPDAPPAPTVTRGDRFLDLSWGPAANNGDPVANHEVEMRSLQGNPVPVPSGRTHRWSNLVNGTAQQFRVRANNRDPDPGAWSAWSTPIEPCGTPVPVGTPTPVRGDTQVSLTWTLPDFNGCALNGIRVESLDGSVVRNLPATATNTTITGLTNGNSYQFRVRGSNVMGDGGFTAASAVVVPAGPPCRVTNLSAQPNGLYNSTYSLTEPCSNGAGITGWELRVNGGAAENATITDGAGPSIAGVRSGLAPNSGYSYEIRACNVIGCATQWSNISSFTSVGPPSTPSNFRVSNGTSSITWSWNSVVSNGSGLRYELQWFDPNGILTSSSEGLALSFTFPAPQPYIDEDLQVRACNQYGCSAWSARLFGQVQPAFTWTVARNGVWLRGTATGLGPNQTWNVRCFWRNIAGDAFVLGFQSTVTSDANGSVVNNLCSFDIPGREIGADIWPLGATVVNQSNIIIW